MKWRWPRCHKRKTVFTYKARLQGLIYRAAALAAKHANFKLASVWKIFEGCGLMPEPSRPPPTLSPQSDPGGLASRVVVFLCITIAICCFAKKWWCFRCCCKATFDEILVLPLLGHQEHPSSPVTLKQSPEERYRNNLNTVIISNNMHKREVPLPTYCNIQQSFDGKQCICNTSLKGHKRKITMSGCSE